MDCNCSRKVSHSRSKKRWDTLWAWGRNFYGQLGDGTAIDRVLTCHRLGQRKNWTTVTLLVANHTIARRDDGTIWSWGDNRCRTSLALAQSAKASIPTQIGT